MTDDLTRALADFDAKRFVYAHGGYKESRSPTSAEYLLACPYCASDRLRWNARKGAWICWGCRKSGDSLSLIATVEGVTRSEAIAIVMRGYDGGNAVPAGGLESNLKPRVSAPPRSIALPTVPWPAGVDVIEEGERYARALDYLARRGLSLEDVRRYRLGFGVAGRLRGYVVFPCYMGGQLVYWQARATWDPPDLPADGRKAWIKRTRYIKSLNVPGASAAPVLFNYDQALHAPEAVVVEGPIDAMKVGPNAVALLGKIATADKFERLIRMSAKRFTIYLDRGSEELASALDLAQRLANYVSVRVALPPEGMDAGDLTPEENARVIAAATPIKDAQMLVGEIRI